MAIAQKYISEQGYGLVIILDQDGKGNGHLALMQAAKMASEESIPQSEAYQRLGFKRDARDYAEAAEVLTELGVCSIELLTNNPDKEIGLKSLGITIVATRQVALDLENFPELKRYYDEKAEQGHNVAVRLCLRGDDHNDHRSTCRFEP
jgi:3,4-dihydroxy 2-butanone 4-phosphate synthase/GTP cyclohydrolase II